MHDLITSSDALPLSYRRLIGGKAIKLGSWDKHPAYCLDLNVESSFHESSGRKSELVTTRSSVRAE